MGISGLWKALPSGYHSTTSHSNQFAGQTVAVDCSAWLHRSVYGFAEHFVECSERLQRQRQQQQSRCNTATATHRHNHDTNYGCKRCVQQSSRYVVQRCQDMLVGSNWRKIVLVLDGKRCPLKAGAATAERESRREAARGAARRARAAGRTRDAHDKYRQCIHVTGELAAAVAAEICGQFSRATTNDRVQLVWAPYEADAQLVWCLKTGLADAIYTEDSDVFLYSLTAATVARPILSHLERKTGACHVSTTDRLVLAPPTLTNEGRLGKRETTSNDVWSALERAEAAVKGAGVRALVQACVLAGCDYCGSIDGVGLATALKTVVQFLPVPAEERLGRCVRQLLRRAKKRKRGSDNKTTPAAEEVAARTPEEWEELLSKAEAVFYYHPIRTATGKIVPLAPTAAQAPSLERFADRSFLGLATAEEETPQEEEQTHQQVATSSRFFAEGCRPVAGAAAAAVARPPPLFLGAPSIGPAKVVANPYAAARINKSNNKPDDDHRRRPLKKLSGNDPRKEKKPKKPSYFDYLKVKEDVRFAAKAKPVFDYGIASAEKKPAAVDVYCDDEVEVMQLDAQSAAMEELQAEMLLVEPTAAKRRKVDANVKPVQQPRLQITFGDDNCKQNLLEESASEVVPSPIHCEQPAKSAAAVPKNLLDESEVETIPSPFNGELFCPIVEETDGLCRWEATEEHRQAPAPINQNDPYISTFRNPVPRRVTMEDLPSDGGGVEPARPVLRMNIAERPVQFDMYDDFFSPRKPEVVDLCADEIEESPGYLAPKPFQSQPLSSGLQLQSSRPKKTFRFRLGGDTSSTALDNPKKKRTSAIGQAFQRQRELAAKDPTPRKKKSPALKRGSKQGSIFAHFARARARGNA